MRRRTVVEPADVVADSAAPQSSAKVGSQERVPHWLGSFIFLWACAWPPNQRSLKLRAVLSLLAIILGKLTSTSIPLIYKAIVDSYHSPAAAKGASGMSLALHSAPLLICSYGVAKLSSCLLKELRDVLFLKVAFHATRCTSLHVFSHLHRLPIDFHLARQTGALGRTLDRGSRALQLNLLLFVFNVIPLTMEFFIVAFLLQSNYGSSFTAVMILCIGAYTLFTMAVQDWRRRQLGAMRQADSKAGQQLYDSLLNYETIKYFDNDELEAENYTRRLEAYERARNGAQLTVSLLQFGQLLIVAFALTFLIYLAARRLEMGLITVGDLAMINTLLLHIALPLDALGAVYRLLSESLTDMQHMLALLRIQSTIPGHCAAPSYRPTTADTSVEFEHVWFGYDADCPILKGLSFFIPNGKTVAIVGQTGEGKSTVIRLLYRFYDVQGGSVRVGGCDVRQMKPEHLRKLISVVPQGCVLFNNTVAYNIGYGDVTASRADIVRAAEMTELHEMISAQADGYDATVGERGLKLSGGELQRLALARALLKNAPIVVYDEATSNLDSITEQKILRTVRENAKERTLLIIAHRLSTIVDADIILVMANGRIAERGTHEALMLIPDGIYRQMWNRQRATATEDKLRD